MECTIGCISSGIFGIILALINTIVIIIWVVYQYLTLTSDECKNALICPTVQYIIVIAIVGPLIVHIIAYYIAYISYKKSKNNNAGVECCDKRCYYSEIIFYVVIINALIISIGITFITFILGETGGIFGDPITKYSEATFCLALFYAMYEVVLLFLVYFVLPKKASGTRAGWVDIQTNKKTVSVAQDFNPFLTVPDSHAKKYRKSHTFHKLKENLGSITREDSYGIKTVGTQISNYNSEIFIEPFKVICLKNGTYLHACCSLKTITMLILYPSLYVIVFILIIMTEFIPKNLVNANPLNTIVTFFLGLYLSLHISRWWRLRTDGIGNIWGSTSTLSVLIGTAWNTYKIKYQNDLNKLENMVNILKKIKNIRRLCELSMALVFTKGGQQSFDYDKLNSNQLLNNFEKDKLIRYGGTQTEVVWSWISKETALLYNIDINFFNANEYWFVINSILKGRRGAGLIAAQLGCQLPFTYTHGVTLMAHLYLITSVILMPSNVLAEALIDINANYPNEMNDKPTYLIKKYYMITILFAVTQFMFFIIKGITIFIVLTICQQIQNPFSSNLNAFPGLRYTFWVAKDWRVISDIDYHHEMQFVKQKIKELSNQK